ncbi:guanine nucleotide binding protein, alpha subunit [Fomitopsis serialis]|uniref:guanine nucleotide binding protein, alpha subunit n=1 Tax=Fomitopsis serialis TaxID=139415 RepID=UPI002008B0EE|nr:guanine nucleotide binding protein, alpha subunit [Neoantrodia serialis]KAH9932542.1 guanine nucleotide binding protein, alpha subunit [Neoantrodia serialis]
MPHAPHRPDRGRRINNQIDEELRRENEILKRKRPREVKDLDRERPSWRPIVYFNILKAIRMILSEVDYEYFSNSPTSPLLPSPSTTSLTSVARSKVSVGYGTGSSAVDPAWLMELSQLRNKLLPLRRVTVSGGKSGVFVRAGWQALNTATRSGPRAPVMTDIVAKTLDANQNEIEDLWHHPGLRLEEYAAFFLDNIHRIARPDYLPSTEDILHVRLQTLGVKEHAFDISMGGINYNWLLYDVGGARQAWIPYFEDAAAIIFLAPISAYDQYLEEDPRTNRIDDSLQLFTSICTNKLLHKAALVLMLNKTDLLRQKLEAGIKVRKYISSYGDRPNTYEEVSEYFRAHFIQVHRRKDVNRRPLFAHFTSMLDIKATQSIIVNVNEAIMRRHMATVGLA